MPSRPGASTPGDSRRAADRGEADDPCARIDLHLLGLHHVRDLPAHVPLYDWLLLGIGGIGLIAVGWLLTRGALEHPASSARARGV
jgi:hypothetical protein